MKRPTRDDVARLANVSGWTVSNVLNGRTGVSISDATRERVLAAAEKLGYRPNHMARALATGNSRIISLWTGMFLPFYVRVVNCLQAQLREQGYQILITNVVEMPEGSSYSPGPVDGIIAIECPMVADLLLGKRPDQRIPFVSIGVYHLAHMDHVGVDLASSSRAAIEHLVNVGCRRVAYVLHTATEGLMDPRRDAYLSVLSEAGLEPEFIRVRDGTRSESREVVRDYVSECGCPDGIFCHNDDKAIGVYRALRDLGLRVPDDVAIVGCDGLEDVEYLDCPITTIVQPVDDMCRQAWEFLQRRMGDPSLPVQEAILNAGLVVRESSRRRS